MTEFGLCFYLVNHLISQLAQLLTHSFTCSLACCRYGFVKFMTKEGANKSMIELHQTEMEAFPNMKVGNSTG